MRLSPVTLDQIALGEDGSQYLVTGEAGQVAKALAEIDGVELVSHYIEKGDYFEVAQVCDDPQRPGQRREFPVLRVQPEDWGPDVVALMQQRAYEVRHMISAADRLDAQDKQTEKEKQHAFEEAAGEVAEELKFAVRKDLGIKTRAVVPS